MTNSAKVQVHGIESKAGYDCPDCRRVNGRVKKLENLKCEMMGCLTEATVHISWLKSIGRNAGCGHACSDCMVEILETAVRPIVVRR